VANGSENLSNLKVEDLGVQRYNNPKRLGREGRRKKRLQMGAVFLGRCNPRASEGQRNLDLEGS
jgi:hypothetical protein